MKQFTVILFITIFCTLAKAEILYYLYSDFETIGDQNQWTNDPSGIVVQWDFRDGGENYPLSAWEGDYNAILERSEIGTFYNVKLVSPPIDLSVAVHPRLSFHFAQAPSEFGQEELKVYFKAGPEEPWDLIEHFPDENPDWTQVLYDIDSIYPDDPDKYLVEGFQVAFEGKANSGQGSVLDLISITEEAAINKFIKSYSITNIIKENIPSGTVQPIAQFTLEVLGNTGMAALDSLSLKLETGNESFFKENSFTLYATSGSVFRNKNNGLSSQIGTSVGLENGIVKFSNIDYEMDLGLNYFWVTTEISETAPHNSNFSFSIEAEKIHAVDSSLPEIPYNNIYNGSIRESIFIDNFEEDKNWTLQGDFERDIPQGFSSLTGKTKDPDYAYSFDKILGTDLTDDGVHLDDIDGTNSYAATTPYIDLLHYNQIKIHSKAWFDFSTIDRSTISVSNDGGKNWETIWRNHYDLEGSATRWTDLVFENNKTENLQRNDSVLIRFSIDSTNDSYPGVGFNIDDFAVTGNILDKDIGITQIYSPFDECLGYFNDTVKVVYKNYAFAETPSNIPVFFGLYGADSVLIHDTIHDPIAVNDSIVFTFNSLADFPRGDFYSKFVVGHSLAGDEDNSNDTLTKSLIIPNNISPSHTEFFEYNGGVWIASDNSTWQWNEPDITIGSLPGSEKAWVLSPYGDYLNNNSSFIQSSCYDLTKANRQIIEFSYWNVSEYGKDGFNVEYSTDDGNTWLEIDTSQYGKSWGWYSDTVEALGKPGISGILDDWRTAHELLPASLAFEPKVKFRLNWASDGINNGPGVVIDNFKIYTAPIDVGVSHIDKPVNSCLNTVASTVELSVKNYGFNDLKENDTLILGIDFEGAHITTDTILLTEDLEPGDSVIVSVNTGIEIEAAGDYTITAYTLIEDDPYFYNNNNDSLSYTYTVWPLPDPMIPDTIESRQPDTVVIRANTTPGLSYLWSDGSALDNLDVPGPGTFHLTVTEATHGCSAFDSTFVELLYNDVGIDSILSPISACENTSAEPVIVRLKNFGTDSLILNDVIYIGFSVGGSETIRDTIVLTESLREGNYIDYEMKNGIIDVSTISAYNLSAYSEYGGDTVTSNNTYNATTHTYGYPSVDIGPDTVVPALSYTFDAGAGFATYDWNSGDSTQLVEATSSGLYIINILDNNGCPASDSADLWLKIRDVEITGMTSPVTSCGGSENGIVSIKLKNNGTDTLNIGDTLNLAYSLNKESYRKEMKILTNELLPGQVYDYSFYHAADISEVDTHSFTITVAVTDDLLAENDSLIDSIYTHLQPVVDFGPSLVEIAGFDTTLDAGYGEHFVYDWQNDAAEQTFNVTYTGMYWVNVTDTSTGCTDGDTINIKFDILDYTVASIDMENSYCNGEVLNGIEVSVQNSSSWGRENAEFDLVYNFNEGETKTQHYVFDENWEVFESKTFTIDDDISINSTGTLNFAVAVKHDGDLRPGNDTSTKTFLVIESPEFAFDKDTVTGEKPYTIDAGSGYADYLWEDVLHGQKLVVDKDGMYHVEVFNAYNCSAKDSIYVIIDGVSTDATMAGAVNVNIYPNPVTSEFFIDFASVSSNGYWVELYSTSNQLIFKKWISSSEYHLEYDANELIGGVYLLRVISEESMQTYKILKH